MTKEMGIELVRVGDLLAEVEVRLREVEGKEWSPSLPLPSVRKLERVRKAMEAGDLVSASREARLYHLEAVLPEMIASDAA